MAARSRRVRTAAVSGVAIRHFAPAVTGRAPRAALIGAGVQGHSHLAVLGRVLPGVDADALRSPPGAGGGAGRRRHGRRDGIGDVTVAADARAAVRDADVVVTAASFGPVRQVMTDDWLAPDALVVPVDYATYLRRRGRARRGALPRRRPRPVPRQPRRRPVRRLPRPDRDASARRSWPGPPRPASGPGRRDASRGRAGGRRLRRRDRPARARRSASGRCSRAEAPGLSANAARTRNKGRDSGHTNGRPGRHRRGEEESVRIVKRAVGVLLVVVLVAIARGHRAPRRGSPRARSRRRAARPRSRALGERHRRPRRDRDRPHHRRHDPRPVPRPGLRPRPGADVADGGLAPHLGRAARRAVRARASSTPTSSSGRSAGAWRRSATSTRSRRRPAASSTPTRRASTPGSMAIAARSGLAFLGGRRHARTVDGRSTRSRGARSRRGTSAATSTRRSSAISPTRSSATRRGPTSCSRPIARMPRSSRRPALPGSGGAGAQDRCRRRRVSARSRRSTTSRPIDPAEAAAWRSIAGLGQGLLAAAGLDARRRPRLGPRDRLERLGRRPRDVADRRRTPRQRPAPRHLDAVGLVHERPALPDGLATPARTTSPASRSRACPGVVLGHNARIAWGATNVDPGRRRTSSSRTSTRRTRTPTSPDGTSTPFDVRHETDQGRRRGPGRRSRSDRRSTARSSTTSTSG